MNPIPIAPTRLDMKDLTIAVNLSGKARKLEKVSAPRPEALLNHSKYHRMVVAFIEGLQRKDKEREPDEAGFSDVISKSIDTMQQNTIARLKLAAYPPGLIIEIPKNTCSIYESERARELVEIGRRQAKAALESEL